MSTFDPSKFAPASHAAPTTGADPNEAEFTMDDLAGIDTAAAQTQALLAADLSPRGWYETDPERFGPLSVRPRLLEFTSDDGQRTDRRKVVAFRGRMVGRFKAPGGGTTEVEAPVEFEIAAGPAEARAKRDASGNDIPGKVDLRTKLYAQACAAFKRTFNEDPPHLGALCDYLSGHAYRINLLAVGVPTPQRPEPDGDPKNLVYVIQSKRDRQGGNR